MLTCLVTGNLEPIGWAKMRALGLFDLFSAPCFGGFGSDTCSGNIGESWKDRAELVRIAAGRAQQLSSGEHLRVSRGLRNLKYYTLSVDWKILPFGRGEGCNNGEMWVLWHLTSLHLWVFEYVKHCESEVPFQMAQWSGRVNEGC